MPGIIILPGRFLLGQGVIALVSDLEAITGEIQLSLAPGRFHFTRPWSLRFCIMLSAKGSPSLVFLICYTSINVSTFVLISKGSGKLDALHGLVKRVSGRSQFQLVNNNGALLTLPIVSLRFANFLKNEYVFPVIWRRR